MPLGDKSLKSEMARLRNAALPRAREAHSGKGSSARPPPVNRMALLPRRIMSGGQTDLQIIPPTSDNLFIILRVGYNYAVARSKRNICFYNKKKRQIALNCQSSPTPRARSKRSTMLRIRSKHLAVCQTQENPAQ